MKKKLLGLIVCLPIIASCSPDYKVEPQSNCGKITAIHYDDYTKVFVIDLSNGYSYKLTSQSYISGNYSVSKEA